MGAMPVQERMTAKEYLAAPFGELPRFSELIDGELVVNEPNAAHGAVQGNLYLAFRLWIAAEAGRGQVTVPIDVGLDEGNVFAPDLSWYSAQNALDVTAAAPYGLPDLVAEVRSPATWRYDVGAKKATYERLGLPELWLADTAAAGVLVFRRSTPRRQAFDVALELDGGDVLESPLLPGFALGLEGVFDLGTPST